MTVLCVHQDLYPYTDHGRTCIQLIWYEKDGEVVSPKIRSAAWCERFGAMPPSVCCPFIEEKRRYAPHGVDSIKMTEKTHDEAYYMVSNFLMLTVEGKDVQY